MRNKNARLNNNIQILVGQIEKIAAELDTVKKQSRNTGKHMSMDGAPQFFNPKTMQPEVFKGGPRENFVAWARKVRNYLSAYLYGLQPWLQRVETSPAAITDEMI